MRSEYTVTFNNEDGLGIFYKRLNQRLDSVNKRIKLLEKENKILSERMHEYEFRQTQLELKINNDKYWKYWNIS